ncbi:MAG TPA: DUF6520 family protein [Puia sp.]|jgi:hypothetical protein|nr:DUF6520 family protein [Puia sp.]
MKRIKMLLYPAAFVLALSASFAFKPNSTLNSNAYTHSSQSVCTTLVTCSGGGVPCVVGGLSAFTDENSCRIVATMP